MSEITIPAETAAHVLWQDNLGGWPPSTFSAKLLTAWTSADTANAERLAVGFPEHAAAIALVRSGQQGIETLQTIADGEHDGRVEGPDAPVDLSKWAAEITGDQLEPLDSSLSMQTSSGPLVRILFAVRPDMPQELRDHLVFGLGQEIAKFLPGD
jgi:hypothetical protein